MKIRPFFSGLALGAIATTLASMLALHGNDLKWQHEAYNHCAGVYYLDKGSHNAKWMWLDDYVHTIALPRLKERARETPSPIPSKWEKI